MKSSNAKPVIFDAAFITYSLALLTYLSLLALHALGMSSLDPTQEAAAAHMGAIGIFSVALVALGVIASRVLRANGIVTLGSALFQTSELQHFRNSLWGLHLTFTFLITLVVAFLLTDFSLAELADPDGLRGALRLFNGLAHANLSLLPTAITQVIETIFIAFLATVIALPMAFIVGFISAKNIMKGHANFAIYALLRTLLNIIRSVEPLIWALIFTVWVGVGPFAGMLALMLHTAASLAKQFSEIVEDVPQGPVDGVRSTGASAIQVIWFAIVPQVLLPFISFTIYRWDTNVRMATVIGLVGGGGIGTLLIKYQGQAMWPEVGCIILVIAIAVWLMDVASAYIREAIR